MRPASRSWRPELGTWGTGHFESDDAQDWVWLFEGDVDGMPLKYVLRPAAFAPRGALDAVLSSCALAAAAVVARAAAGSAEPLPDELESWVEQHRAAVDEELVELARAAVAAVRDGSELRALWDESGAADWLAQVDRLGRALGEPLPKRKLRKLDPAAGGWSPELALPSLLALNRIRLDEVRSFGLAGDARGELTFAFQRGRDDDELRRFLSHETDYELVAAPERVGRFGAQLGVVGTTSPIRLDLAALDDWVRWLVEAGWEHGACRLDGWGFG